MANNNNETTTKFKVDISELKTAMQEAKRQISIANSEFKAVSSSMDNWGKSSDGLRAKLKQLDSNLNSQKTILKNLESQYEAVVSEQGANSAAADRLKVAINNQKAAINNTEKQIKSYGDALNTAEQAEEIAARTGRDAAEVFDELANSADDAGKSAESAANGGFTVMKGVVANLVSDVLSKAVDALKDFAKASIETGMGFESSMSEVAAISGATGKDLELLEKTAKEYGATTTFSASEAAQALKYMALAGWDAEKSSSALGGVLDLAAASGMELAQASDMVTDYLSAFGLAADQSTYFADMLAYAQSNSNTSAEQLGEAYKNSAANMKAAGQDVETTTALLAMMANQGFKGSEAGTALTAMMRDLTAKMKDGQIMIGDTAVTVMDANGNYRDMTDILKDVEAATQGMGDAERATALSATFTADSTKGLNLLLNAGVGEAEKFEEALRGAGGSAGDMADVMNDNLAGDVKAAQSALEDLQITAYDELQPALRDIVQYATQNIIPMIKNEVIPVIKDEVIPAIKEFIGWIVDHKDEILAALAGIAAGFAAFKVVGVITSVISAVKNLGTALSILKVVMAAMGGPVTIIITLVAALVTGFITLWNTSDEFRNFWIGLWESISAAFSKAWSAITTFFTETLPQVFQSVINWIKTNWVSIVTFLINPFAGLFKYFYDNNSKFREFVDNAVTQIKQLPSKVWTWLKNTIDKVAQWGRDLKAKGKEAATDLLNAIVNKVKEIPAKMKSIGSDIVKGLWNGINDMVGWISGKIQGFGESVLGGIKDFFGIHSPSKVMADEVGKWIPEGIAVGIDKNAKSVLSSMKNLTADSVVSARTGLTSASGDLSGSAVGGVVNNFYQTNNSPKALSRLEIYRQSKNLLGYAGGM